MSKKIFLILVLGCVMQIASAQTSNLVLFSEKSEPFTLVLNGEQVNNVPVLNLKVTGLQSARYQMRVLFNNPSLPEFNDFIIINAGNEATYTLVHGNPSMTELRFVNEFSLVYRPIPPGNQQVIPYTGPVTFDPPPVATDIQPAPSGGSVTVDLNVGGQVSGIEPEVSETTTTTTTTTTITTSDETLVGTTGGTVVTDRPDPLPGYTGSTGCDWPMSMEEFTQAKSSIDSKSFSDSKMQVAKQVAKSNCLLSSQVKDIMGLFSFETDKLEFAKFAYDYTYDLGNYYQVNDAFSFEGSIDDLEQYLSGR
jgi:hypothetical protein